eukprot:c15285_g1_i1 orf=59-547(+)
MRLPLQHTPSRRKEGRGRRELNEEVANNNTKEEGGFKRESIEMLQKKIWVSPRRGRWKLPSQKLRHGIMKDTDQAAAFVATVCFPTCVHICVQPCHLSWSLVGGGGVHVCDMRRGGSNIFACAEDRPVGSIVQEGGRRHIEGKSKGLEEGAGNSEADSTKQA